MLTISTLALILGIGAMNIACFIIGAKVGQTVKKGEDVKMPSPVAAVREHKARKETQQKQDRMETILQNIESYDGTPIGQRDVPGR